MNMGNSDIFLGVSKILVIGSFGASLVRAMRHDFSLQDSFMRLLAAFLGIFFFREYFSLLSTLSDGLSGLVDSSTGGSTTAGQIWDAQVKAGATQGVLNGYSQMLKFSVWGVVSSLIDLVFILSRELLTAARDVLWQLCVVLFPLAASLAPYFPNILMNLIVYSLEIALWVPVLAIIDFVISVVSKHHLIDRAGDSLQPDLGIPIIAIQLMSIILIFSIPNTTNRIVSGALSGDFSAGPSAMLAQVVSLKARAAGLGEFIGKMSKSLRGSGSSFVFVLMLFSASVATAQGQRVFLYPGFVTKLQCRGKILVSALGNEELVRLETLPNELGCGVILKARTTTGTSNLVLETSTGTYHPTLEIRGTTRPKDGDLLIDLGAGK